MSMMLGMQLYVTRFDLTAKKWILFLISNIRALGNIRMKNQKYQVSTKGTIGV